MRAYVVLFCVVALAALTIASPRRARQIIPDDRDILPDDLSGDEVSDRWWMGNRPTRPTRPSRPTRPTPTTTPPSPPSQAALDRCMRNCLRTPQYDPVCASLTTGLRKTYSNPGERMCAELCGEASTVLFKGTCTAIS